MRTLETKAGINLWDDNGALFSSEKAFNEEYVVFCTKYKEIVSLISIGVKNVVCIKNNPERLKNFIRFREGRMDQVIIYVRSDNSRDILAEICKKPYYAIVYPVSCKPEEFAKIGKTVDSYIHNIKKDKEQLAKRIAKRQMEKQDDDELEILIEST